MPPPLSSAPGTSLPALSLPVRHRPPWPWGQEGFICSPSLVPPGPHAALGSSVPLGQKLLRRIAGGDECSKELATLLSRVPGNAS